MLAVSAKHKVFVAVQAIDFRCGIEAISALCKNQLALDPFNGHYFIFRNRKATAIKLLFYDSQGFWLCHKRLSKGSFRHWPKTHRAIVYLNNAELQVLLHNGNPAYVECAPPWRLIDN